MSKWHSGFYFEYQDGPHWRTRCRICKKKLIPCNTTKDNQAEWCEENCDKKGMCKIENPQVIFQLSPYYNNIVIPYLICDNENCRTMLLLSDNRSELYE